MQAYVVFLFLFLFYNVKAGEQITSPANRNQAFREPVLQHEAQELQFVYLLLATKFGRQEEIQIAVMPDRLPEQAETS